MERSNEGLMSSIRFLVAETHRIEREVWRLMLDRSIAELCLREIMLDYDITRGMSGYIMLGKIREVLKKYKLPVYDSIVFDSACAKDYLVTNRFDDFVRVGDKGRELLGLDVEY